MEFSKDEKKTIKIHFTQTLIYIYGYFYFSSKIHGMADACETNVHAKYRDNVRNGFLLLKVFVKNCIDIITHRVMYYTIR